MNNYMKQVISQNINKITCLLKKLTSNCALRVESISPTLSSGVGDAKSICVVILTFLRFPLLFSFSSSILPLKLPLFFSALPLILFVISLFFWGGVPTGCTGSICCWDMILIEEICLAVIVPLGDEVTSPSSSAC